jgi:hypothetical protein
MSFSSHQQTGEQTGEQRTDRNREQTVRLRKEKKGEHELGAGEGAEG